MAGAPWTGASRSFFFVLSDSLPPPSPSFIGDTGVWMPLCRVFGCSKRASASSQADPGSVQRVFLILKSFSDFTGWKGKPKDHRLLMSETDLGTKDKEMQGGSLHHKQKERYFF